MYAKIAYMLLMSYAFLFKMFVSTYKDKKAEDIVRGFLLPAVGKVITLTLPCTRTKLCVEGIE